MYNNQVLICTSNVQKPQNYWKTLKLYNTKPHIVNKRVAGSVDVCCFEYSSDISASVFVNLWNLIKVFSSDTVDGNSIKTALEESDITAELCPRDKCDNFIDHSAEDVEVVQQSRGFILINKLLAKNLKTYQSYYELTVLDIHKKTCSFLCFDQTNSLANSQSPYAFECADESIIIKSLFNDVQPKHSNWLVNVLLPKFVKWCDSFEDDHHSEDADVLEGTARLTKQSLSLIDIEQYNELYQKLKIKYGVEMVKIWPERTDASKFVYEDVAIASYLLLLWQQERHKENSTKLQSFVDLGCGNGLLVYILSSEGHPGYGIDLRKRGIWDLYPSTTILKIEAITPSDQSLFPDIDWIIGNHSDELSPWIPVISARSSYTSKYFVLPCCAFEFDGTKYQRRNCSSSQYNDFLSYVEEISNVCGFETAVDRLKIPSTKRVCLVGSGRTWTENEFPEMCQKIQTFINERTKSEVVTAIAVPGVWNENFTPRSNVEKVQNCSKVDKAVQEEIVDIVFGCLIAKKRFSDKFANWNVGGAVALSDLAKQIPGDKLKQLKSECGGLQTLLRNNHQLFAIEQGKVQIRLPVKMSERLQEQKVQKKNFIFKQKACWFLSNHPDGCPFSDEDCSFKH